MILELTYRFEGGTEDKIVSDPSKPITGDIRKFLKDDNKLLKNWQCERLTRRLHPGGGVVSVDQNIRKLRQD